MSDWTLEYKLPDGASVRLPVTSAFINDLVVKELLLAQWRTAGKLWLEIQLFEKGMDLTKTDPWPLDESAIYELTRHRFWPEVSGVSNQASS